MSNAKKRSTNSLSIAQNSARNRHPSSAGVPAGSLCGASREREGNPGNHLGEKFSSALEKATPTKDAL